MKKERSFPIYVVNEKAEDLLRRGHVWVYCDQICQSPEKCENGSLVDVVSKKGAYLGTGLLSENSKIRIRLLGQDANEGFGEAFFMRRLKYALEYRKTVMGSDFECCRLVFGEADGLPGLTVDRYGSVLVTQVLSYGIEIRKEMIFGCLVSLLEGMGVKVDGIFERNDVALRELEGLLQGKGWYEGVSHTDSKILEIIENGIKYKVDIENGQKTGFFLDQKYNRLAVSKIAAGKRVLDCFTHTGSFAMNAAKGGAAHVTAVDVSESAVKLARENAEMNGLCGNMDFVCADVFDLLPELCTNHANYDFVILDPPAFTKSRKSVLGAERGYKEINYRAMRMLPRGGYLATCSCSHFMENEMFVKVLMSAASDAGVRLKLIEARRQSPDHPTLMSVPETDYLKFYLFQLV